MKIHLGVFILALLILSCSEEPAGTDNSKRITIKGSWLWVQSSGGFFGKIITPPAGTKVIHTYTTDSFFYVSRNDTILISSRYQIETNNSVDRIVYDDTTMVDQLIRYLSADTLNLSDGYWDGFCSLFVRVRH
jgi:hypothetical protein